MSGTDQSQSVHWSKDFVEHLRLVHLTLVAVSVAIIIIVMSANPYKPAVAVRELHQIVELKKLWSVDWIRSHSDHSYTSSEAQKLIYKDVQARTRNGILYLDKRKMPPPDESEIHEVEEFPMDTVKVPTNMKALPAMIYHADGKNQDKWATFYPPNTLQEAFLLPDGCGSHRDDSLYVIDSDDPCWQQGESAEFLLPNENWVQVNPSRETFDPTSFPASLHEFEVWWNVVSNSVELDFPMEIPSVFPLDPERQVGVVQLRIFPPTSQIPPSKIGEIECVLIDGKFGGLVYYAPRVSKRDKLPHFIVLPITKIDHAQIKQQNLQTFFGNWKTGHFEQAFSDLKKAAKDFDSLELEDIEKILDTEAAKGAEIFEVLGIKIPVNQVTIWGTAILLGVQIYLLLFLRQLNGKLGPGDAGWDVPWVGMDQTRFAQYVLFLTLVILPCVAIAVLGGRAILLMTADYRGQTGPQWTLVSAKIILVVGAVATCLVLATLSWRYRPRIKQEPSYSCPPQLFE